MLVLNQSEFIHVAPFFFFLQILKNICLLFTFVFKAYGILVPHPGIEPISPALEGGFLITTPPVVVQSLSCVSLQLHELQHTRFPCPSPSPGVYPNSCQLSP